MGKLSGTVLILAGVSLAAYTLSSQHEEPAKVTAAQAPVAATATADATAEPSAAREARTTEAAPRRGEAPTLAKPAGETAAAPPQNADASAPVGPSPATLVSPTPTSHRMRPRRAAVVRVGEAPPRVPVGEPEATAGPPLDRPALTREIQRQLKRVGCYQGAVTGVWGPSARQAMKAFTDRVNATLPIDQPDPVLLAMVQSQASGTCSASCPAGESRASDGRCLPTALIANAGKLRPPSAARGVRTAPAVPRSTPADVATIPPPIEGRMSLAGPAAAPQVRGRASPPPSRARAEHHGAKPSARSANARARGRYHAAQRQNPGLTGFPGWFLPFSLP